jgi:hypothetical protein
MIDPVTDIGYYCQSLVAKVYQRNIRRWKRRSRPYQRGVDNEDKDL